MAVTIWPVDAVAGSPSYTAQMARQCLAALAQGHTLTRPLGALSGVIVGSASSGTVVIAGTDIQIGQVVAVVDGETSSAASAYFVANDATVHKTLTAADATQTRIDLISIQISDPAQSDGTSTPQAAFVYTVGTPGSGVAPATPSRALACWQISVPSVAAGGSPVVTMVAKQTVAAGGIQPVAGPSSYPSSPYNGQAVYDMSLDAVFIYNGTSWAVSMLPRMQMNLTTNASIPNDGAYHKLTGWSGSATSQAPGINTIGGTNSAGIITLPAGSAGQYEFTSSVSVQDAGAMTGFSVQLQVNGVITYSVTEAKGNSSIVNGKMPTIELTLADGDQISLWARSYGDASTTQAAASAGGWSSWFRLKRVA